MMVIVMASNERPTHARTAIPIAQLALALTFVAGLLTSQVISSKLIAVDLPVSLPIVGALITFPGGVLAYAVTFFASDCYAELYGKAEAQKLVNAAFVMNFVLLGLVWATIYAPIAGASPLAQDAFKNVLGSSTGIVVGSLTAYMVSQNYDVVAFHAIRDRTGERYLWLRNVLSTGTSQFVDTVLFVGIAFWWFQGLPADVVVTLIVGQYIVKLLIALVDTPLVYATVAVTKLLGNGENR